MVFGLDGLSSPYLDGDFYGGTITTVTGCSTAGNYQGFTHFTVTGPGADGEVWIAAGSGSRFCTYHGPYTQAGRMGRIVGTFSCVGGGPTVLGTFTAFELEVGAAGFTSNYTADYDTCRETGRIAGARRLIQ